jgi:DnaJ-class molecular chaperone
MTGGLAGQGRSRGRVLLPLRKMKDFYGIIGVPAEAKPDEIRSAFRKLALKFHPDRNQGNKKAEAKFKEISQAYDILIDEKKRKLYDEARACPKPLDVPPPVYRTKAQSRTGPKRQGSPRSTDPFRAFWQAASESTVFNDILRAAADQRRERRGTCPVCKGKRTITMHMGLFVMGMPCPICIMAE